MPRFLRSSSFGRRTGYFLQEEKLVISFSPEDRILVFATTGLLFLPKLNTLYKKRENFYCKQNILSI